MRCATRATQPTSGPQEISNACGDTARQPGSVSLPWHRLFGGLLAVFAVILVSSTLAMAGAAPANAAEPNTAGTLDSLLDLIGKGGRMMIPIGLCSLVAVAVAVERLVSLRRSRIIPRDFMEGLAKSFGAEGTNMGGAQTYCERLDIPIARVIRAGVVKLGRRLEVVEKAVEDAAAREVGRMRRGLEALAVVGTISPLMGLLGTIYGMISAFRAVGDEGLGSRGEALAEGIYAALVTTAAGLTVAVPTLLVYYMFVGRVERLTEEIEHVSNEFLDQCYEEPVVSAHRYQETKDREGPSGRWIEPATDTSLT
jgi:biopolymer transport protein ExbB